MHNALGLRTLKLQKEHFDRFITKSKPFTTEINAAMQHGIDHEVKNISSFN